MLAGATIAAAPLAADGGNNQRAALLNSNELLRYGPQLDARGIKFGSFIVLPSMTITGIHDSNVLATNRNERSDRILKLEGDVSVASDWSRHALQMYARGGGRFHDELTDENAGDFKIGAAGRIDVYRSTWVRAFADYAIEPEERGTGESFFDFKSRVGSQTVRYGALAHQGFNRFWAEAGVTAGAYDFEDVTLRSSGGLAAVSVDQDFRDGTYYEVLGRVGYEISPLTSLFLEASVNERDYTGTLFDSDGYKVMGGLRYQFSAMTQGEVALGYLHQDLDRTLAGSQIDTLAYRAHLRWQATPLIAFSLIGSRDVGTPSLFNGASNRVVSEVGSRADYAIQRDVILSGGVSYDWVEYVGFNRTDNRIKVLLGAEYLASAYVSVFARIERTELDSGSSVLPNGEIGDYSKIVGMAGVRLRY